jgi:hypothetical protein
MSGMPGLVWQVVETCFPAAKLSQPQQTTAQLSQQSLVCNVTPNQQVNWGAAAQILESAQTGS